jgi:hypothetical protein
LGFDSPAHRNFYKLRLSCGPWVLSRSREMTYPGICEREIPQKGQN